MTKIPAYYTTKTLKPGNPDRGARYIYRGSDHEEIARFNHGEHKEWTPEMQRELNVCHLALLKEHKRRDETPVNHRIDMSRLGKAMT